MPTLMASQGTTLWTESFIGLDRRPRAQDGAFSAMGNMTGEQSPLIASRGKRGICGELGNPLGLYAMEELAWIDGPTLYYNRQATPVDNLSMEPTMLPKRMVSMGAYLLIFPDGAYYNTVNPEDYGSINRLYQSPEGGEIRYALCDQEGNEYPDKPEEPEEEPEPAPELVISDGVIKNAPVYGMVWGDYSLSYYEGTGQTSIFVWHQSNKIVQGTAIPGAWTIVTGPLEEAIPLAYADSRQQTGQLLWARDEEPEEEAIEHDYWLNTTTRVLYERGENSWEIASPQALNPQTVDRDMDHAGRKERQETIRTSSDTEPENPIDGDIWVDTSETARTVYVWHDNWIVIPTVYLKIAAPGIGAGLEERDGVTVSGVEYAGETPAMAEQAALLNETSLVVKRDQDWIVIVGVLDENFTQQGRIRADRKAPELDFVIACNNRLWGCRHGDQDGETVNRIYACALGDFKNWRRYEGTSQDSYFANVGSDGPFTGAICHRNMPYFFKETVCHYFYGDRPSNWTLYSTPLEGPMPGAGDTLAAWNGTILYLNRHGPQIFDSAPSPIGEALGEGTLLGGAAAVCANKYYLCAEEEDGHALYILDLNRGTWHRQDRVEAVGLAPLRGEMYLLGKDGLLWALRGTAGEQEPGAVTWYAETAEYGYEYPRKKYVKRFTLRLRLGSLAECRVLIQYDGDGIWRQQAAIQGRGGVKDYLVPIIPRRCTHCRLRLEGQGDMALYGIARELSLGSDAR